MKLTRRPELGPRDLYHYFKGGWCTARCMTCGKQTPFHLEELRYGKPKCCGVPMKLIADEKV